MERRARWARARSPGLLHAHHTLDLTELGVGRLHCCGTLDQQLDADVVANRHLVDEAAEIPLELCDACGQLTAARFKGHDWRLVAPRRQALGAHHPPPKKFPVNFPFWNPGPVPLLPTLTTLGVAVFVAGALTAAFFAPAAARGVVAV